MRRWPSRTRWARWTRLAPCAHVGGLCAECFLGAIVERHAGRPRGKVAPPTSTQECVAFSLFFSHLWVEDIHLKRSITPQMPAQATPWCPLPRWRDAWRRTKLRNATPDGEARPRRVKNHDDPQIKRRNSAIASTRALVLWQAVAQDGARWQCPQSESTTRAPHVQERMSEVPCGRSDAHAVGAGRRPQKLSFVEPSHQSVFQAHATPAMYQQCGP